MLLEKDLSALLVVDIQEKLMPLIHESEMVRDNSLWLMKAAQTLDVPILVSEQYPKGLGQTIASLRELVSENQIVDKVHFSCAADSQCFKRIQNLNRPQIVVIGIEAHVCVLQTAMQLAATHQIFVVVDAISSRHALDKEIALKRLQANGINLVSKEMVLFEWLHQAGTDLFRTMSKTFLK